MRDDEQALRRALSEQAPPDAAGAEERAWRVVRAAFAEGVPRRPRRTRRAAALALAGAIVIVAISPAGAKVRDWVDDAVTGSEPSQPALTALPAPGRLLVDSAQGPWIVQSDGSKRLLGDYEQATWSPHGLFVAATSGHQLVALDPHGDVRWSVARQGLIATPRWSPDGFRIAYLSGAELRIVAADGTGDHVLRRHVSRAVAPAWRPGSAHVVGFGGAHGTVQVASADTGRPIFRTARLKPLQVLWSADGSRLIVVRTAEIRIYNARGRLLSTQPVQPTVRMAAVSPRGEIAVLTRDSGPDQSRLLLIDRSGHERQLFAGPGEFSEAAWSPDGASLLLAWRSADQWLFLRPDQPRRTLAVSNIAGQFSPGGTPVGFPAVAGWCCAP
ncbi:MAG TPA: hypothetical protein VIZ61_01265 [Solirubrobacterales bacterium]